MCYICVCIYVHVWWLAHYAIINIHKGIVVIVDSMDTMDIIDITDIVILYKAKIPLVHNLNMNSECEWQMKNDECD